MQMKYCTSVFVILVSVLIAGAMYLEKVNKPQKKQHASSKWVPYEAVLCYPTVNPRSCYFYIEPKYFSNKQSMESLARHFSQWSSKAKKNVNFYLYDDRESVMINFHSDVSGMFKGARGIYIRARGRELLLYKPTRQSKKHKAVILKGV